jgi:hypothetical protein
VAKVVDHLPNNGETLISIPTTAQKGKEGTFREFKGHKRNVQRTPGKTHGAYPVIGVYFPHYHKTTENKI